MTLTLFIELFIETQLHSRGHYVDVLLFWTALLQALLRIKMIWLDGPSPTRCLFLVKGTGRPHGHVPAGTMY